MLTAKVHHEDVQRGYELGADYYIKKPFNRFKLLASINLLLGVRDRRTAKRRLMLANSGKELFAGLEKQMPDLILLDIMMPQMGGLEVLERLKGNPGTASIPVIMLTAKVHHEDVQRGYELGADYYIKKPFNRFKLLASINLLLGVRDRRTAKRFAQVMTSNLAGQTWLKRGDIKDSISIS